MEGAAPGRTGATCADSAIVQEMFARPGVATAAMAMVAMAIVAMAMETTAMTDN